MKKRILNLSWRLKSNVLYTNINFILKYFEFLFFIYFCFIFFIEMNVTHSEVTKLNNKFCENEYVGQDLNDKKIYAVIEDIRITEKKKW